MTTTTLNLALEYLDPSQAQPEVKINDAWDKIDAAIGTGLEVTSLGETSPPTVANGVRRITFQGCTITNETGGALVRPDDAGVVKEASWTNALGAISIPINTVIRLSGAKRTIKEVIILTQGGPGSCTVLIWKANMSAHYPPVAGDDITGGTPPAIVAGNTYQNSTLAGWNTALVTDDVLLFTLQSCTTFTNVTITLRLA